MTSMSNPASRSNPCSHGEDEARIRGCRCGSSILGKVRSVSRYVKTTLESKVRGEMLGASLAGDACEFRVWAPTAQRITLRLLHGGAWQDLSMERDGEEHFRLHASATAGDRYFYIVDDHKPVPDPV